MSSQLGYRIWNTNSAFVFKREVQVWSSSYFLALFGIRQRNVFQRSEACSGVSSLWHMRVQLPKMLIHCTWGERERCSFTPQLAHWPVAIWELGWRDAPVTLLKPNHTSKSQQEWCWGCQIHIKVQKTPWCQKCSFLHVQGFMHTMRGGRRPLPLSSEVNKSSLWWSVFWAIFHLFSVFIFSFSGALLLSSEMGW